MAEKVDCIHAVNASRRHHVVCGIGLYGGIPHVTVCKDCSQRASHERKAESLSIADVTAGTASMSLADHQRLLNYVIANPPNFPSKRFSGRGIVICAGTERYLTCAYICIRMLRRAGCSLPIELWHRGPEEVPGPWRAILNGLGVGLVDAFEVAKSYPCRILNGWELKCYSIVHTRFREVLLLDADNVPLRDPEDLFETAQYKSTGAVFWPDRGRLGASHQIWEILELAPRDAPEFESGQIVLDKCRCWDPLSLAMHMNEWSDFYYQYVYGDKETFNLSWLKLGQPFTLAPPLADADGRSLYQHDFEGNRIFQHRGGCKWALYGCNQSVRDFMYESECLEILDELRASLLRALLNGHTGDRLRLDVFPADRPTSRVSTKKGHRRQFFSQHGEDDWITNHLSLPFQGIFVEVGAHDGISGSNTLAFERAGWNGVVIESDPRSLKALHRNRRCLVLPYAIGTDSDAVFHLDPDPTLSGFLRSGSAIHVTIRTLGQALEEAQVEEIDLLSIDTEGTELDVWASFDPDRYRPKVVIIEYNTQGLPDRSEDIRAELIRFAYREVRRTEGNLIFVRNPE